MTYKKERLIRRFFLLHFYKVKTFTIRYKLLEFVQKKSQQYFAGILKQ